MIHLNLCTFFILMVACYCMDEENPFHPDGEYVSSCPFGWIEGPAFNCYGFGTTAMTWADAMAVCKAYSGTLAEPTTGAIYTFLKRELGFRRITADVWIGGNDIFEEKRWDWVSDSSDVDLSNFHQGQPDNYKGEEDCLEMVAQWNYQWNDNDCRAEKYFICQRWI